MPTDETPTEPPCEVHVRETTTDRQGLWTIEARETVAEIRLRMERATGDEIRTPDPWVEVNERHPDPEGFVATHWIPVDDIVGLSVRRRVAVEVVDTDTDTDTDAPLERAPVRSAGARLAVPTLDEIVGSAIRDPGSPGSFPTRAPGSRIVRTTDGPLVETRDPHTGLVVLRRPTAPTVEVHVDALVDDDLDATEEDRPGLVERAVASWAEGPVLTADEIEQLEREALDELAGEPTRRLLEQLDLSLDSEPGELVVDSYTGNTIERKYRP